MRAQRLPGQGDFQLIAPAYRAKREGETAIYCSSPKIFPFLFPKDHTGSLPSLFTETGYRWPPQREEAWCYREDLSTQKSPAVNRQSSTFFHYRWFQFA